MNWYVAHCAPLKEPMVAVTMQEHLRLEVYLPMVNCPVRGALRPAPLFPGYLFVRTEADSRVIHAINDLPGVLRLLAFDGSPQPIPTVVIQGIREQVERINQQGGLPTAQFYDGETVRITAGPLKGLEAIFLASMPQSERVRIMLEFLGQCREAEIPVALLERGRRESRGTRGRGRPIKTFATQNRPN